VKAQILHDQMIFRPPPKSGKMQHNKLMCVPQEELKNRAVTECPHKYGSTYLVEKR